MALTSLAEILPLVLPFCQLATDFNNVVGGVRVQFWGIGSNVVENVEHECAVSGTDFVNDQGCRRFGCVLLLVFVYDVICDCVAVVGLLCGGVSAVVAFTVQATL